MVWFGDYEVRTNTKRTTKHRPYPYLQINFVAMNFGYQRREKVPSCAMCEYNSTFDLSFSKLANLKLFAIGLNYKTIHLLNIFDNEQLLLKLNLFV